MLAPCSGVGGAAGGGTVGAAGGGVLIVLPVPVVAESGAAMKI